MIGVTCGILLIVIIQAMGITYAKYITSEKGSGQAEIAKWAFQIVKEGAQTKNVQLVNSVNTDTLVKGKIALGTSGTFCFDIDRWKWF